MSRPFCEGGKRRAGSKKEKKRSQLKVNSNDETRDAFRSGASEREMSEPSSLNESDEVKVGGVILLPEKSLTSRGSGGVGGCEKRRG